MNDYKITELMQVKMSLEVRIKQSKLDLKMMEAEMKFVKEQIDLLTINQLKINFDGEASTT
jgi:hypothetical protein